MAVASGILLVRETHDLSLDLRYGEAKRRAHDHHHAYHIPQLLGRLQDDFDIVSVKHAPKQRRIGWLSGGCFPPFPRPCIISKVHQGIDDVFVHLEKRVVVVDLNIQRIVLATGETTVAQQVSHRPIKYKSHLLSQRGTKVNGSHRGGNPPLRLTGVQSATKSYATLQALTPTNIKTVHQTFVFHIKSSLDRLGLLSLTHDQRSQQQSGQTSFQPVLINKFKFFKATHRTKISKTEIPRSMVVEALSW